GMMMLCETRQMSSNPEGLAQLEAMIKRYRNSPSIIMWSMGNEEDVLQATDQGGAVLATMVRRSHELDPTRLCTAAVNNNYGTGLDYRGEPTPYGWPSINSQFGIVDMCGFPKDNFYYYKAWWGAEPVLHLFPHWNWEQREGEPISVWVHSNLEEVELFLNGTSQ